MNRRAAHVPTLDHNLLSLSAFADEIHSFSGDKRGIMIRFKSRTMVFALPLSPRIGQYYILAGRGRSSSKVSDVALATISPRVSPATTEADVSVFHVVFGPVHEENLRETVKRRVVTLAGHLEP